MMDDMAVDMELETHARWWLERLGWALRRGGDEGLRLLYADVAMWLRAWQEGDPAARAELRMAWYALDARFDDAYGAWRDWYLWGEGR